MSLFASLVIIWVVVIPAAVLVAADLAARRRQRRALLLATLIGGDPIAPAARPRLISLIRRSRGADCGAARSLTRYGR